MLTFLFMLHMLLTVPTLPEDGDGSVLDVPPGPGQHLALRGRVQLAGGGAVLATHREPAPRTPCVEASPNIVETFGNVCIVC